MTFLNIQIDLIILETDVEQFTLTTQKSLHIIFKDILNLLRKDQGKPREYLEKTQDILRNLTIVSVFRDPLGHFISILIRATLN